MSRPTAVALLALALAAAACASSRGGGRRPVTDGGAGGADAGWMDAAPIDDGGSGIDSGTDGGRRDAGSPDAGGADAGSPDAGGADAGPPDAGPPDAGPPDAGPGTTMDYPVGGRTRSWTASGYWRGNIYRAGTPTTLRRFASYLSLSGTCELGFYVFTSSTVSGPFVRAWSGSASSSGTGYHSSGPIDLVTTAGVYYTLGVGWTCSTEYYSAEYDTQTGTNAGIGTLEGNAWSNSYSGYSLGFTPGSGGAGGAHYDQVITIGP